MPDLSISRQDIMAKQMVARKQASSTSSSSCIGGVEFQLDNQKMTIANSLFQTIIKGNINKVRHLLARGTQINLKNDYGYSPLVASLHIEDNQKRAKMFQLLLEKGASTKVKDTNKTKRPVLHWACVLGQTDQVMCLLEETAGDIDLNDKDADGLTALHHAVKIGSLRIVDILVDYHVRFGITVDSADGMGLTPYMHARRLGYRDVAAVLKTKGLASAGHGDKLFRSPREWSQIGKFERKKAIVLENQDRINAFKIMGKVNMIPLLENNNSPRMAIPGIAVPSYRPDYHNQYQLQPLSSRKPPHHLSSSLPSLSQAVVDSIDHDKYQYRPQSASRPGDKSKMNTKTSSTTMSTARDKPGAPMVAFADPLAVDSDSSFRSVPSGTTHSMSNYNRNTAAAIAAANMTLSSKKTIPATATTSYVTIPTGQESYNNTHSFIDMGDFKRNYNTNNNDTNFNSNYNNLHNNIVDSRSILCATQRIRPVRSDSNVAALNILQQTTKGRMVSQFHHSEFDKTKESEYKQMLGNLTSIMDVLAQQQTKSFRKSVEVKKPETPPKVKKKNKVSTLAIIFGSDGRRKRSGRKKKNASPSNPTPKGKGGKRGKSPKNGKKGDTSDDKPKNANSKPDRLPVPTIKIS